MGPTERANLEPHPTIEGVSRYITPGTDVPSYTKFITGAVTFYYAEKSKNKDMDADELMQISDAMKSAMATAASAEAELVLESGPGAALINVAITDINVQNKKGNINEDQNMLLHLKKLFCNALKKGC